MQTTLKKSLAIVVAAFALCLAMAGQQAWAAEEPSATIDLQDAGNGVVNIVVKDYDKLTDVTTCSLILDISANDGNIEYIEPVFLFSDTLDASVKTYTSENINGIIRMNIYVAGNSTGIFPEDSAAGGVFLGALRLSLDNNTPDGLTVSATVNLPAEMDAFSTVNTAYTMVTVPEANLRVQDIPTVSVSTKTADAGGVDGTSTGGTGGSAGNGGLFGGAGGGITGAGSSGGANPSALPGGENTENGEEGVSATLSANGPVDTSEIIGMTAETNPDIVKATDGNNMPLIVVIIVCIVIIAVAAAITIFVARRKHNTPGVVRR